jgi:hypothetical protein
MAVRIADQYWRTWAACRPDGEHGLGPAGWDGPLNGSACRSDQTIRAALAVCEACPVIAECREWADAEPGGAAGLVAGGQFRTDAVIVASRRARQPGRPRGKASQSKRCGTAAGYQHHRRNGERACRGCLDAESVRTTTIRDRRRDELKQYRAERYSALISGEATA